MSVAPVSYVALVRAATARRVAALAVLALVLVGAPAGARADVGDLVLLGDQANLMGGAVAASIRGGSAMWYNPAGLSSPEHDRTSIELNGVGFALRWYRAPELVPGATSTGAQNAVYLPRQVTFVLSPNPKLRFGFGFFNPIRQDLNLQVAAAYPSGSGTGSDSLALRIDRGTTQLVVSMAYELRPGLHVGGSLQFVSDRYFDMVALGSAFIDPSMSSPGRSFSSVGQLSTIGAGVAATFGVTWQATKWLKVGASLTTPSVLFVEFIKRLETNTATNASPGGVQTTTELSRRNGFSFASPDPGVLRVGVAITLDRATLEIDGNLVAPAKALGYGVDRGVSANAYIGGIVQVVPQIRVGAGFFTVRGGTERVPNYLGATSVDGIGGTAGLTFFSKPPGDLQGVSGRLRYAITGALRYTHYGGQIVGATVASPGDPSTFALTPNDVTAQEIGIYFGLDALF